MSQLDQFAMRAMAALITDASGYECVATAASAEKVTVERFVARSAYDFAEAMVEERKTRIHEKTARNK